MNELKIFKNETFGEVRTVIIDEEPWFLGKDVAESLGYKNARDALSKHVGNSDKMMLQRSRFATFEAGEWSQNATIEVGETPPFKMSNYGAYIISLSGVFSLIFSSKLESAVKFRHWVTSDILPTLYRAGYYSALDSDEDLIAAIIRNAEDDDKRGLVIRALQAADINQCDFVTDLVGLSNEELNRSSTLVNRTVANLTGKRKLKWWEDSGIRVYTKDDFPERYRKRFYMDMMIKTASKKKDACDSFASYCGKMYFTKPGYLRIIQVLLRAGNITKEQRDEWLEEAGLA